MKIIPVGKNKKYWNDILDIRNNNSFGFGDTSQIPQDKHYEFIEKHYKDYFVLVLDDTDKVAGFAGCVNGDIRVAVHENFKRRGIAKALVTFIRGKYPKSFAKIKSDNQASLKLFQSCGLKKTWCIYE